MMNKRLIAIRALAILLMLVFLRASARKLFGVDETVSHFQAWGYPHWFMLLVASIELCGAVLLPFFRTMRLGSLLLVPIMLGAIGTQVIHGAYPKVIAPAVVLTLLLFLATRKQTDTPITEMRSAACNT